MRFFGKTYSKKFSKHLRWLRILIPIAVWAAICGFSKPILADGEVILRETRRGLRNATPASGQLREELWLAHDRDTMANMLLQREAQPADSLLPQWLSGYAFLFESAMTCGAREQFAAPAVGLLLLARHYDSLSPRAELEGL